MDATLEEVERQGVEDIRLFGPTEMADTGHADIFAADLARQLLHDGRRRGVQVVLACDAQHGSRRHLGQDVAPVEQTLQFGRQGEMPTWAPRLGAAEINLLALYVSQLGDGKTEAPK